MIDIIISTADSCMRYIPTMIFFWFLVLFLTKSGHMKSWKKNMNWYENRKILNANYDFNLFVRDNKNGCSNKF